MADYCIKLNLKLILNLGKFALSLASLIHNDKTLTDIKMEGIAIGNGFLDPETLLCYGDFLYQIGLVDNNTKQEINKLEIQGRKAIHDKHFVDAFYVSTIIPKICVVKLPTLPNLLVHMVELNLLFNSFIRPLSHSLKYISTYIAI